MGISARRRVFVCLCLLGFQRLQFLALQHQHHNETVSSYCKKIFNSGSKIELMKRKYEPKPYSSQGNLDTDTELVSWISDGMQKLSRYVYMQMEECEGVMQYNETFYTYFQRKYGACAYSSAVLIISSTPPPPQSPSPPSNYPTPYWVCGQNPLWRTCVVQGLLNLPSVQKDKIKPYNRITT